MIEALDIGATYRQGREDVAALVRSLGPEQLQAPVPACPGWSVHDIVSHLTGVAADVMGGSLRGMPTPEQTAAQVAARADQPTSIVLREWERAASQFEVILSKTGSSAVIPAIDVAVHEHDVRGAVGIPGNRDSQLVAVAVERALNLFYSKLESAGLADIVVHDEADQLIAGNPDAPVSFRVSRFELFRAAYGRRSSQQIQRRLLGTDDPGAYVAILCLLGPAAVDLIE